MKLFFFVSLISIATFAEALKEGDCEGKPNEMEENNTSEPLFKLFLFFAVCINVLDKFRNSLPKEDSTNADKINGHFKKFCKDLKLKENRFVSVEQRYMITQQD